MRARDRNERPAEDPGLAEAHLSGRRGTHEKAPKLPNREVPVVLPGEGKDTPDPGLGEVVRGLFSPEGDAISHSPKEVAYRSQPQRVLEEGPDTLQDHETRAENPAHLDEVENDLPPGVAKSLTVPDPTEGLARETGGDDLDASVGRPEGPPLDGVTRGPGSVGPGTPRPGNSTSSTPTSTRAKTVWAPSGPTAP